MVIRELLRQAELPRLDAEVLLAHVLGVPREKLFFMLNETAAPSVAADFSVLCSRRQAGWPAAYLIGEKEFYSLSFYVNEHTLIPRPDTETLVEWAIAKAGSAKVLDLCCGTGCIGISVAANASVRALTLADISGNALAAAKKNAARHNCNAAILQIDILQDSLPGTYDLILSNPPYIETDVIPTLDREVRAHEPHLALDGGEDGLLFYPFIIGKAAAALADGGWLGLEIGYTQGEAVSRMMHPLFEDIQVLSDLGANPRAVVGRKKINFKI